ncbi:hypothetical protein [Camelimonas fluminis]
MSKALTDIILSARENVDGIRAAKNTDRRSDLCAVSGGGLATEHPRPVAGDLQRESDLRVALEDISVDAAGLMREAHALSSRIISPALMRNIDWAREAAGLEPFVWPAMVAASAAPTPVKFKQAAE